MNYLIERRINGFVFIDGNYSSRESAKRGRDSMRKMKMYAKGTRTRIIKRSKVECSMCGGMVKSLCSNGSCLVCNGRGIG